MNRFLLVLIYLFCILVNNHSLSAQVSSMLSTRQAEIGEQNTYVLKVQTNDSSNIQLLPWETDPNLEFFNESPWTKQETAFTKSWSLIAWDSGYYEIPPFEITIGGQNFATNPHMLLIGDIQLADSIPLADIKPIIEEEANLEDYLIFVYLFLVIGLLAFIFWYVYKKNQAGVNLLDPPVEELKRPAHIIARKALKDLDEQNYLQEGKEDEFETGLSFISRKYISSRYNILALEKGNNAFMEELRTLKDFPEQIRSAMLRALPEMELVKYAGQSVSTEKHMQYRALIGQLIDETSNNEEQKYILIKADEVLQEAIEEGMQRSLSLGAVKKLNRLLIDSGHYGTASSNTILCKWNFHFPFLKSEAASIDLPKPIIDWHEKGMSTFFSMYNRLGLRLSNAGMLGSLLFILLQPVFLLSSVVFVVLDLIQGKKIFGTGKIVLEADKQIRFLYEVQENAKNQEV